MTIAEKIKYHRKLLNMTQTEFGQKLGVQKNAVSKWETGRVEDIPASKIKAMADIFSVPPSYLIDDAANMSVEAELIQLIKKLTPENQKLMLDFVKGLTGK